MGLAYGLFVRRQAVLRYDGPGLRFIRLPSSGTTLRWGLPPSDANRNQNAMATRYPHHDGVYPRRMMIQWRRARSDHRPTWASHVVAA
jgi:hypothetical protein